MTAITFRSFFDAWVQVVNEQHASLKSAWRNRRAFTSLIKGDETCVLEKVAKLLNLRCYPRDYYHIDAVLYDSDDLVPGIAENSFWFRSVRVAFEHENDFNWGLFREVSHLLLMNAELKVLVTYPNGELKAYLDYLHQIIKGSKNASQIAADKTFLIILGYENGYSWEGYVFESDDWECFATTDEKFYSENPARINWRSPVV